MNQVVFVGFILLSFSFVKSQTTDSTPTIEIGTNSANSTTSTLNTTSTTTPTTTTPTTTTPTTTTPTTSAPTTTAPTTTAPTTASPIPSKDATANTYKYNEGNTTCLIVTVKVYFNKSGSILNITNNYSLSASESSCGRAFVAYKDNSFILHFKNDTKLYWLSQIDASIGNTNYSLANLTIGKSSLKASYKCDSGFSKNLTNVQNQSDVILMFAENVQFQAFQIKDGKYGTAQICSADIGNEIIIPIAVGCALAGLIVLVLIAYMIGRKQVKHRYEAM